MNNVSRDGIVQDRPLHVPNPNFDPDHPTPHLDEDEGNEFPDPDYKGPETVQPGDIIQISVTDLTTDHLVVGVLVTETIGIKFPQEYEVDGVLRQPGFNGVDTFYVALKPTVLEEPFVLSVPWTAIFQITV